MLDALILIGLIVLVGVLIDVVILILAKILPPNVESEVKEMRYESGNIPIERPKYVLPFQYIPFLILFLALEPIVVIILLLTPFDHFLKFLAVTLTLTLPPLVGGVKLAKEVGH